jgi:hypothetical protein
MRLVLFTIFTLLSLNSRGQNGYVKLDGDSTIYGYLRYYNSIKDGHQGIELWRTKTDKEPLKIPKEKIDEYAIRKDTFKVLHQFKPFHDTETYFELVDAKLKISGKIGLYVINSYQNVNRVSTYTGGGLIPAIIDESLGNNSFIYILEDKATGFLKAIPSKKEKLKESLIDFFPEKYVNKYIQVNGELKYKTIPDLVKLYNSK